MRRYVQIAVAFSFLFLVHGLFHAHLVAAEKKPKSIMEKKKRDIHKIKEELSRKEKLIKKLRSKEVSILSVVENLDSKINRNRQNIKTLNKEKKNTLLQLREIEADTIGLKKKIDNQEREINARLRSSYKMGRTGFLKVLLSSESYSDFLKKRFYLRMLIASEDEILSSYIKAGDVLKAKLVVLNDKKTDLESLSNRLGERLNSVRRAKGKKLEVLRAVKNKKDLQIKRARELSMAAKDLEKMIRAIVKSGGKASGLFALNKGELLMPVGGKIGVRFGESLDGNLNVRIFSKGLSIKVNKLSPVKSVFDGKIIYAGPFRGYGNILIVDHGDNYYSLYARVLSIRKKAGDSVTKGEEIGMVGGEDSIHESNLYFELRHNGLPIDPSPWFSY